MRPDRDGHQARCQTQSHAEQSYWEDRDERESPVDSEPTHILEILCLRAPQVVQRHLQVCPQAEREDERSAATLLLSERSC